MTNDRLAAAEALSAHAYMRGDLAGPSRRDPHPFQPLSAYVGARCPTPPEAGRASADFGYDDVLTLLVAPACQIRRTLLSGRADLVATRLAVATLRERLAARYAAFDDAPFFEDFAESTERAATDTVRLAQVADICLAGCGDREALARLAETAETCVALGCPEYLPVAVGARGLLAHPEGLGEWQGGPPLPVIARALELGRSTLAKRSLAVARAGRAAARETHAEAIDDDRPPNRLQPVVPEQGLEHEAPAAAPGGPGVVVFPQSILDGVGKSENRMAVKQTLGSALGARLRPIRVPADWGAWEAPLVARSPWLAAVPRALFTAQGGREHWGHTVVCVVGPPGCGKSRQIREIAQASGLHYVRLNAEAAGDTSAFGTSVRWASSQPGLIERAMVQAQAASALIHYDELEKSAGSRQSNSGKITDLLHSLWEPETARSWMSGWLHHPIDAGHIVHVVTVNSLDGLPTSLVDRMRIVRVGDPGPENLAGLAPPIASEICRELGQDPRFGAFDGDEMAALAEAWRGGSIRRLQRLVAGVLQARESGPAAPRRH